MEIVNQEFLIKYSNAFLNLLECWEYDEESEVINNYKNIIKWC